MRDLSGKAVLVLGASGGLGGSLCRVLAERGARLFMVARHEQPLRALDLPGEVFLGDVTQAGFPAQALAAVQGAFGRLDGVINAAGAVAFGRLADTPEDVAAALWAVNFQGPFRLMQAFALGASGGFLVNITGVVAEQPFLGLSAYGASKAALSMATRALSLELRARGTLIQDARPGHTQTNLAQHPLYGTAPAMKPGMAPEHVARRIVLGVEQEERELPSTAFA